MPGRLLELLLGIRRVVVVRMKFASQAAEGLLDLGLVCVARDAEHS